MRPSFQLLELNSRHVDYNFSTPSRHQPTSSLDWDNVFQNPPTIKIEPSESLESTVIVKAASPSPTDGEDQTELSEPTEAELAVAEHGTAALLDRRTKVSGPVEKTKHDIASSPSVPRNKFPEKNAGLSWDSPLAFSVILPLDVITRLSQSPNYCVSSVKDKPTVRCGHRTKLSKADATRLLGNISALQGACEFSTVAKHILELVENSTCNSGTSTHRMKATAGLKGLCDHFYQSRDKGLVSMPSKVSSAEWATLEHWLQALSASASRTEEESVVVVKDIIAAQEHLSLTVKVEPDAFCNAPFETLSETTISLTPGSEKPAAIFFGTRTVFLTATVSHHLNYLDFHPFDGGQKKSPLTPQQLIRDLIRAPLTRCDLTRNGFIYVFWHPGNFGYVKIGRSSDVERRLADWKKQCGYQVEEHVDGSRPEYTPVKIPHTHRVESLIHAELKDKRRHEPRCKGCGISHHEWFEVPSPNHALRVVEKWTSWMRDTAPYEGGKLKASITSTDVDKLCVLSKDEPVLRPALQAKREVVSSLLPRGARAARVSRGRRKTTHN